MMSKIIINYIKNTYKKIEKEKRNDNDLIIELLRNNNGFLDNYERISFRNNYCQEIFINDYDDDDYYEKEEDINRIVIEEGNKEIKCIKMGKIEISNEFYFIYKYKNEDEFYLIIIDNNHKEIDMSIFTYIKDIYKYLGI
jgi:hypothetical protein